MRDREGAGRRQEADVRRSVTQVFYADGEKRSTAAVRAALGQLGAEVTPFRSAADCLNGLKTCECQLLISNARRPGIEGMELLLGARRIRPSVPIVVLVDHGDIEVAVRMMKAGAADCLERPPETGPLVSSIEAALQESVRSDLLRKHPLSPVEQQVLDLVLEGCTNQEIALRLHRSARTIEVHRSHIMRKLHVSTIVHLIRAASAMGLLGESQAVYTGIAGGRPFRPRR